MSTISIRRAAIGDAETIAKIHVQAWRESYAGMLPKAFLDGLSVERRAAWWQGLLDETMSSEIAVFVAVDGKDRTVGFGSYGRQRDAELDKAGFDGEFETIYLLQDAKRQGIGRQLMVTMAAAMVAEGYRGGALWVLRENHPARRFYEALGGTVVSEREERRGDGLVLQEVAYGWSNLEIITTSVALGDGNGS